MADKKLKWWTVFAVSVTLAVALFSDPEPLVAGTAAPVSALPWWGLPLAGAAIALAAFSVFRKK